MAIARGKKKNHKGEKDAEKKRFPLWAASWVGTTLTVVSALSFLVVCMLLPLVGQAGVKTEFSAQNRVSFVAFCIFSLVLSLLAIGSKLASTNGSLAIHYHVVHALRQYFWLLVGSMIL